MTHFLLALVVLAGAVVVALDAVAGTRTSGAPAARPVARARPRGRALALVVSGAVATAAGPHPGDSAEVRRAVVAALGRVRARARDRDLRDDVPGPARLRFSRERGAAAPLPRALRPARRAARPDGGRRAPVPDAPALGARARARRAGGAVWAGSVAFVTLLWRPRAAARVGRKLGRMASELRVVHRPRLERPVLIAAFRGWNDGGQGASLAGGYLARQWQAERFADIDPGELLRLPGDPAARLARGRRDAHASSGPRTRSTSPAPRLGRDAILLLGVEPNLRWRTFAG